MTALMSKAARILWTLAGLVLVAGGAWGLSQHLPPNLEAAVQLGRLYLSAAATPLFFMSAGLAVVLGLGASAASKLSSRAPPPLAKRPSLSPLEVVNEDVAIAVREMLVELGQYLRGVASRPEPDIILFMDTLMDGAIRLGASDVHIHPLEAGTRIAFRVHGVLEEVLTIPREVHPRLINRIKVLGKLTLYKLDKPQDGHFPFSTQEGPADIRISILPTNHGEAVALRIARSGVRLPQLTALGFPTALHEKYRELLGLPQGVIFVAGATGSGKTTSLYASLGYIKESRGALTRIASIEDPVEFDVPLFAQTQVNSEQGFTFAQGLRSVLRQDPNVIMVGEIRDPETARTAIQAGLSGHLILTTIHANSAAGVFNRLIEMGVEPFLLASATVATLSQRLVRALCPHCRTPSPISPEEVARLDAAGIASGTFYGPVGCERCGGSGYLGRTAIYEMLTVSPALRDGINEKLPSPRLQDIATSEGMVPLLAAGVERARAGATTLREVFRVVGG
ncbi:GspE/PulE family protein [Stigmatella sp. ncwal1]|uniref:GspE/PulE family protein n=1 Tax=Stigmatella ashevillensis TaxID=2995309 RepID=A0ABT5DBD2_9BACT|nr:GspE/PulE family protein [Stigmatella ashevillena]MDC0710962.1 GspE/PulE family protein [Stigmatella ashevillena]